MVEKLDAVKIYEIAESGNTAYHHLSPTQLELCVYTTRLGSILCIPLDEHSNRKRPPQ